MIMRNADYRLLTIVCLHAAGIALLGSQLCSSRKRRERDEHHQANHPELEKGLDTSMDILSQRPEESCLEQVAPAPASKEQQPQPQVLSPSLAQAWALEHLPLALPNVLICKQITPCSNFSAYRQEDTSPQIQSCHWPKQPKGKLQRGGLSYSRPWCPPLLRSNKQDIDLIVTAPKCN